MRRRQRFNWRPFPSTFAIRCLRLCLKRVSEVSCLSPRDCVCAFLCHPMRGRSKEQPFVELFSCGFLAALHRSVWKLEICLRVFLSDTLDCVDDCVCVYVCKLAHYHYILSCSSHYVRRVFKVECANSGLIIGVSYW